MTNMTIEEAERLLQDVRRHGQEEGVKPEVLEDKIKDIVKDDDVDISFY